MRRAITLAAAMALACPASVQAQIGALLGVRTVSGRDADPSIGQRSGFEFRAIWDADLNARAWSWRAELAGAQVKYQADYNGDRVQVSENSVELAGLFRLERQRGALSGAYLLAGPVLSARLTCGVLGGFVDCADDVSQAFGATGGAGYGVQISPRRSLLFEVRIAKGIVGAAGNPTVTLAIGLRADRLRRQGGSRE